MHHIKLRDLPKKRLQDILGRFINLRIGVIGDLALDAYWYADMQQAYLSRETPHFPRPVVREKYSCGAGANVADNIKAMGVGYVTAFSILGDDWRKTTLQQIMENEGIDCSQIIINPQRSTSAYVKPILMGYESQQEDARIDFVNNNSIDESLESDLINAVISTLPSLDALLIADQLEVNSVITDRIRQELNILASAYPSIVFAVDSRLHISSYHHMLLKPNLQEALCAVNFDRDPDTASSEEMVNVAQLLSRKTNSSVFLTLGKDGILVYDQEQTWLTPSGPTRPPLDPVGAGDTCISAIATSLAAGANKCEAAAIANLAAAVTVEKLNQTGTASPVEILERYDFAVRENI